jgi:hypothetical protein
MSPVELLIGVKDWPTQGIDPTEKFAIAGPGAGGGGGGPLEHKPCVPNKDLYVPCVMAVCILVL